VAKRVDEIARHSTRLFDLQAPRANRGKEIVDARQNAVRGHVPSF
jgi:hypothetical protein